MEINDHHIGWAIYWDIVFLAKKKFKTGGIQTNFLHFTRLFLN